MSNYLAIATVTRSLSHILLDVETEVNLGHVNITTQPPDTIDTNKPVNTLNIFLYHVTPNLGYANLDVPARNSSGELVTKQQLAIDLHYLLTVYSDKNDDSIAHQILASAMRILHENPVITRKQITDTISNPQDPNDSIQKSNLGNQLELVKLTLENISIEEITKLWSSFFKSNYRISVAYKATVVLLDGEHEPKPVLPVQDSRLYVSTIKQPFIEKIMPFQVEQADDVKIVMIGQNLKADGAAIKFDKILEPQLIPSGNLTDTKISFKLPSDLIAGIRQVKVIHQLITDQSSSDVYNESNTASFALIPKITNEPKIEIVGTKRILKISFEPPATPEQKVSVLLDDLKILIPAVDNNPFSDFSVMIPNDLPAKNYILRLQVDEVTSLVKTKDTKTTPSVEVS